MNAGHNPARHARSRGFAVIITVALMVLVALLAVGLLNLSMVTMRTSSREAANAEAQANARVALTLALGELQGSLGPDARISARGLTMARHPRLASDVRPDTPQAWWVGVSNSDPGKGIDPDHPPGADNPAVVWLVSGLDPDSSPAGQISASQPFDDPVEMFGAGSIDTHLLTGGNPISAGKVGIPGSDGEARGAIAYFIDDEGMKAQLAATPTEVRNDRDPPLGGGVLPGTSDLSPLDRMAALEDTPLNSYARLLSVGDLPLIGASMRVARAKRLGYTTRSRGVLSDVRTGRLKRDLSIAFERDDVFDAVFPRGDGGANFGPDYLVMARDKYEQSPELQNNGYIHWEMFKDYYNTKKYIRTLGGVDFVDPAQFHKGQIFRGWNTLFGRGQLGPHAIGPDSAPSLHRQMPYGDYGVLTRNRNQSEHFKHSPVLPVLQRMQLNGWIERLGSGGSGRRERIRTRVQLWTAHYNPHNINLRLLGDANNAGPRIHTYPQVTFSIPGVRYRTPGGTVHDFRNIDGLGGKRQSHVPHQVMVGPGRANVFAFRRDGGRGSERDRGLLDDTVRDLTLESVFRDYQIEGRLPASMRLDVDFRLLVPTVSHGTDHLRGSREISQTFWAPIAWDNVRNRPGKRISQTVRLGGLNENSMAMTGFNLRTTREGGTSIRPLVDANIRAMLNNPKWDSPLGLPMLASYSSGNDGEAVEQIFQMNTEDPPKGYSYWGAGRGPFAGHDRVILFDIPRDDLVSLGQLQHASAGRFSYEPSYIVGNSYANPRIPADEWRATIRDTFSTAERGLADFAIPDDFNLYDASYLVNEVLWDGYVFTTIPQVADNHSTGLPEESPDDAHFEALRDGEALLPNPRFLPYEPAGLTFDRETLQSSTPPGQEQGGFHHNAGHLLVDGLFNVNSTSVDAWEAFLSGTRGLPVMSLTDDGVVAGFERPDDDRGVRFPRVKAAHGGPMKTDDLDESYWTGFRSLTPGEVRELAEAVVAEIRERGPFLSFAEFVNRRLEVGELGASGALQAALDKTVNRDLDGDFEDDARHPAIVGDSSQGAGFPGQLLQGDILQALSPYMTVRSDTFTIRAYGAAAVAGSGRVQAWCEATVQRVPDPMPAADSSRSPLEELVLPSSRAGRVLRVVSFRWLNPREL